MKPRIAFTWLAGCGGCEASLLDLGEELLAVAAQVDIVYWPLVLDHKKERLENLADGALAAAWITGAVRTEDQEDLARLLRRKARWIIAQGACACLGGVSGLANLFPKEEMLAAVLPAPFPVNDPAARLTEIKAGAESIGALPALKNRVKPLEQVISVDYRIPGCPPPPASNLRALQALLAGPFPPEGEPAAGGKALCAYCPRKDSRPEKFRWQRLGRVHQQTWDPETCFLAAGIPCLGPATQGDCGSRCIRGNMPCRGCFGPVEGAGDQGARIVAFLASLLEPGPGEGLEALMESVPDPTGLAYLFSLASCPLLQCPPGGNDD